MTNVWIESKEHGSASVDAVPNLPGTLRTRKVTDQIRIVTKTQKRQ